MRSLFDDLRYSLRMLRNSPGFTAVALITLALGIGANTAVFSLTYAVMLRPLPVQQPERLAVLTYDNNGHSFGLSEPLIDDLNRKQTVFTGVAAWHGRTLALTENGDTRLIEGALISGNAFDVLGLRPYLGRAILPADDQPGGGPSGWAGILGYAFWQSHFRGDPSVLGSTITVEGVPATIIGVAPPNFDSVEVGSRADVLLPQQLNRILTGKPQPVFMMFTVIARLKPDTTLQEAKNQIAGLSATIIAENDPQFLLRRGFFGGGHIGVSQGKFGRQGRVNSLNDLLYVLDVLVAVVLLICCANIAGLLGARLAGRRHELAVRSALGASRSRLLRQLVIEALLLSAGGALAALLFADSAAPLLLRILLPRASQFVGPDYVAINASPDWHVFLFAAVMAACCGGAIAALPGIRATRVDAARDLSAGARQLAAAPGRSEGWIVSGQVAFASLLVVAAALFAGTVYHLVSIDPGFETRGVLIVPTSLQRRPEKSEQLAALYQRMLERLRTMPGIEAASAEQIPMLSDWIASAHYASTLADGTLRESKELYYNAVGAGYFGTSGIRLLSGRDFRDSDRDGKHMVCALNRSAAQFFFPAGNAVGSSVYEYSENKRGTPCAIIGVVEDTQYTSLTQTPPRTIYWTFMEAPDQGALAAMHFVLRTSNVAAAAASARQVLRELAPGTPMLEPITMDEQLLDSIGRQRAMAALGSAFASLALLLTAIGLYGTLSYQVNRRTREIAIRMAVGADAGDVVRMVVRRALLLTGVGVGAGLIAAAFAAPLLKSLLFGVKAVNPLALIVAGVLLLVTALAASFVPARRATRVDPMLALRAE